jgi:hypothetical protein
MPQESPVPNVDPGPVIYRFTLQQIKQAAEDIRMAGTVIHLGGSGTALQPSLDIVGAISQVVGRSHYGAFDSRAVIAESIIMHYLGKHPYTWEDELHQALPIPWMVAYDMLTHPGLVAYQEALQDCRDKRHTSTIATLDQIVEWLNSDRFTGGTRDPQADTENEDSPDIGAHQSR